MEEYQRGILLTLDDNSKYVVFDSFKLNNKNYLYLVSEDDKKTTMVVEVENDEILKIDDEKEKNIVYKELIERNKEEIEKYLEEIDEN